MKEPEPIRAAIIAGAGRNHRRNVSIAKDSLKELKGKTRLNPATLINSLFLQMAIVGCWIDAITDERTARKELDMYDAHHKSPRVGKFYDDAKERAEKHGMAGSAIGINYVQDLDGPSLYELRNSNDWNQQPDAVKAMVEIALAIAEADMGRKRGRVLSLEVGEGAGSWNPLIEALDVADAQEVGGFSDNQTTVARKVYRLLGLDDKIKDIPTIPEFNKGFALGRSRFHHLDEYGVSLWFNFNGSWKSKPSLAEGPAASYPSYIGMVIRAERSLVK